MVKKTTLIASCLLSITAGTVGLHQAHGSLPNLSDVSLFEQQSVTGLSQVSELSAIEQNTLLMKMIRQHDVSSVRQLMKQGFSANFQQAGATPLNIVAEQGDLELARLLVQAGADLELRDQNGHTPLKRAATHGHLSVAKYLLDEGADVNAEDKRGNVPLNSAASHGNSALVSLLLEQGAEVNRSNKSGYSALMHAASHGHEAVVQQLLNTGAEVNSLTNKGKNALQLARQKEQDKIVEALLAAGAEQKETIFSKTQHVEIDSGAAYLKLAMITLYRNPEQVMTR